MISKKYDYSKNTACVIDFYTALQTLTNLSAMNSPSRPSTAAYEATIPPARSALDLASFSERWPISTELSTELNPLAALCSPSYSPG